MENFSVILPIYRDKTNAEKIIHSLKDKSIPELKKVITIVDEDSIEIDWDQLHVIENPVRVGKSRAINQGLEKCDTDTAVLLSSDIEIAPSTVRKLAEKTSKTGGTTSPRISSLPANSESARLTETIWRLHHHISKMEPKLGEAVAFKPNGKIPEDAVADEEYIASTHGKKNYIETEKVYNSPPSSLKQLYKQRRRVFCGHLKLAREEKYLPPTMKSFLLVRSIKDYLLAGGGVSQLMKAGSIEIFARSEAILWEIFGKTQIKWSYIQTLPLKENVPKPKNADLLRTER